MWELVSYSVCLCQLLAFVSVAVAAAEIVVGRCHRERDQMMAAKELCLE